jgi:hypothetical protein
MSSLPTLPTFQMLWNRATDTVAGHRPIADSTVGIVGNLGNA